LDVTRLESGQLALHPSEFDLRTVVEEVSARTDPGDERHPMKVRAPEQVRIVADRDRVDQLLVNLISNAIRYSPDGGAIEIGIDSTPEAVEISVVDHGLGIPKEHQRVIFERFGRAHGPSYGGLGLGLAISKGIVEQHGGTIWVESSGKPGEGSVFHVRLPRTRSRSAEQSGVGN